MPTNWNDPGDDGPADQVVWAVDMREIASPSAPDLFFCCRPAGAASADEGDKRAIVVVRYSCTIHSRSIRCRLLLLWQSSIKRRVDTVCLSQSLLVGGCASCPHKVWRFDVFRRYSKECTCSSSVNSRPLLVCCCVAHNPNSCDSQRPFCSLINNRNSETPNFGQLSSSPCLPPPSLLLFIIWLPCTWLGRLALLLIPHIAAICYLVLSLPRKIWSGSLLRAPSRRERWRRKWLAVSKVAFLSCRLVGPDSRTDESPKRLANERVTVHVGKLVPSSFSLSLSVSVSTVLYR